MGQGGNVWELNEAVIGSSRALRGGSFNGGSPDQLASYRYIYVYLPTDESYDVGFRVASSSPVPEPSTLVLWSGLGAMGLIAAWRRRKRAG